MLPQATRMFRQPPAAGIDSEGCRQPARPSACKLQSLKEKDNELLPNLWIQPNRWKPSLPCMRSQPGCSSIERRPRHYARLRTTTTTGTDVCPANGSACPGRNRPDPE